MVTWSNCVTNESTKSSFFLTAVLWDEYIVYKVTVSTIRTFYWERRNDDYIVRWMWFVNDKIVGCFHWIIFSSNMCRIMSSEFTSQKTIIIDYLNFYMFLLGVCVCIQFRQFTFFFWCGHTIKFNNAKTFSCFSCLLLLRHCCHTDYQYTTSWNKRKENRSKRRKKKLNSCSELRMEVTVIYGMWLTSWANGWKLGNGGEGECEDLKLNINKEIFHLSRLLATEKKL